MNRDVYSVDFTRKLPPILRSDEKMLALASQIAGELQKTITLSRHAILYARIDELDERVLDILAYDLHVDWYDDHYSLEEKRKTLKDGYRIHRRLGTKFAVATALAPIYPGTDVLEWFEYGGDPYHFKILINIAFENVDQAKHQRVLRLVSYYKNLRSHLDGISYYVLPDGDCYRYAGVAFSGIGLQITVEVVAHGLG